MQQPHTTATATFLANWWQSCDTQTKTSLLSTIATNYQNGEQVLEAVCTRQQCQGSEMRPDFVAPRAETETTLAKIWSSILNVQQIGIHDNFFNLGGDSVMAIQAISKARRANLHLTLNQLLDHPTIAELTSFLTPTSVVHAEQGIVTGSVPLTPFQHWFFELVTNDTHHWNQAVMFETSQPLDPEYLKHAVSKVVIHHDALRLRYRQVTDGWEQWYAETEDNDIFELINLTAVPATDQSQVIERTAGELQQSLNLTTGPLLRIVLFELGSFTPQRLLIIVHHLAVDGLSWRILLEDLQTAYQHASQGMAVQLPPKTTSFKAWANRLEAQAQSAELRRELAYWSKIPPCAVRPLPRDFDKGPNIEQSSSAAWLSLSPEETHTLFHKVLGTYQVHILDVLLTTLVKTCAQWTGERSLLINLVVHGREELFADLDLSRTMGWFTSLYPVFLKLDTATTLQEELKAVQEQRSRIPQRGIGYGLLRYLCKDPVVTEQLKALPVSDIMFSYVGQFDYANPENTFVRGLAQERSGMTRSPRATRENLLEIGGLTVSGQLKLAFIYSRNLFDRTTIEMLANTYVQTLRMLIASCSDVAISEGNLTQPVALQWREESTLQPLGSV